MMEIKAGTGRLTMLVNREVASLMRKELGRKAADEILKKIDKMIKRRANREQIEKVFREDVGACIAKEVCVLTRSKVRVGALIASKGSKVSIPLPIKTKP